MRGVREFEEKFETLGPLMFGLADGQSEAPKIMAKKVKRNKYINTDGLRWLRKVEMRRCQAPSAS